MLPLFDDPPPAPREVRERIGIDSPEYRVYWRQFAQALDGQSFTYRDADERITQFARDGHRLGRLLRPLPCMTEGRRQ